MLNNIESAALLSVSGLAERIGTSDATLIRFAQEIGFKGYKEMREHLADYIRKIIYAKKPGFERSPTDKNILNKICNLDKLYISQTIDGIDPDRFSDFIQYINSANRIFCMGWRISSFLAEFLSFQLCRIGRNAQPVLRERRTLLEQVLYIENEDVLIVFDLLLYSTEVYEAVSYLSRNKPGVKIITVTNDPMAQIVQYADLSFFIDLIGQSGFSIISLTAPMCFINAVIEEIIILDPQRANAMLSKYEQEVLSHRHYALTAKF